MKIWFEKCLNYTTDSECPVQLGLSWYGHRNDSARFKSWRGFSLVCYFFKWTIVFNYVNDFDAYDRKINRYKYRKLN